MSSIQLAFLCLAGMIVLMGLRVPIAVALGVTSFVGIWALRGLDTALKLSGSTPFEFAASWNLSAIPMFLLMGSIAYRCGLTTSLFDAARLWLARLPGGLAVAANFASALLPRLPVPRSRPPPRWAGSRSPKCCATATILRWPPRRSRPRERSDR
jgi:C4-dicarboxylate transporter DctM subunit